MPNKKINKDSPPTNRQKFSSVDIVDIDFSESDSESGNTNNDDDEVHQCSFKVVDLTKAIPQYKDDFFENEEPVNSIHGHTYNKVPSVFQMEATECGAACLGMILRYYGAYVPLDKLRIDCGVSRNGSSTTNIITAASHYGLETKYSAMHLSDLLNTDQPCIIHWNFNHFVVFEGVKRGYAYINDPAEGERRIGLKELDESFTGYTIQFSTNDKFKKEKRQMSLVRFAVQRLNRDKHTLFALIVFGVLISVIGMLAANFTKFFIDQYFGLSEASGGLDFIVIMLVVLLFQFYFINARGFLVNRLQAKLNLVSSYSLVSLIFRLPMKFYEQRFVGDLSQRIMNNENANVFLSGRLTGAFLDVFSALLFIIVMIFYSIPLTIVGIVGAAISLLISKLLTNLVNDLTVKYTQDTGKMMGVLFSGIEISQTLKASGVESKFASNLVGYYTNVTQSEQKIGVIQQILTVVPSYITQAFTVLIIVIGSKFVIDAQFSIGTLVVFCSFLTLFLTPINNLFLLFRQMQDLKANIMRIQDIEKQDEDSRFYNKANIALSKDKLSGLIEIKNLSFSYEQYGKAFIDNFNLTINPGEIVALVGPTGCGKSTIAKLICGLIQPWSGEILYDGHKMSEIDNDVYSVSVGYISQSISIFDGSIRDNLTLWNDFIMDKNLVAATKDACIHDTIIKLPSDYDFILKENAKNMSGGQKQRLEIARALVSSPSILIMDEATSALDAIVEQKIMQNLKKRGCSCVVVAHRLSTIRDADRIICINDGKIAEQGTHDELKNKDGIYKKLISKG